MNRGRMLLMLRLPASRQRLADASASAVTELMETYEIAHSAQQQFRLSGDATIEGEYQEICLEIEQEILAFFNSSASK